MAWMRGCANLDYSSSTIVKQDFGLHCNEAIVLEQMRIRETSRAEYFTPCQGDGTIQDAV
jgi:hypothetical protein